MAPVDALADGAEVAALAVEVVHCPRAGPADCVAVRLPAGATVADALRISGVPLRHRLATDAALAVGIWGRRCGLDRALCAGDRVEVYRALTVDPKEARRLRYQKHRQRGIGARRPGVTR